MKTLYFLIIGLVVIFSGISFSNVYAPCIEGLGINCNGYPPPALTQINTDKLSYEISDKPVITVIGVPNTSAQLEIDDPSSNFIFTHDINLSSNGTAIYILDISSYKPGVYSATATSSISKITTSFSIGIISSGGIPVEVFTDKNSYIPGDNVTILGTCHHPNTLIQLSLTDPNGISVKSVQTFSNKTGYFSSSNFTIPTNAINGTWQVHATSGIAHATLNFLVISQNLRQNPSVQSVPVMEENMTLSRHPAHVFSMQDSPLKQFKSGISATDVTCRQDLQLTSKKEDSSPACILPDDLANLVMRGWAVNPLSNILDAGYSTQEQQDKLFYDIMNLPQLRQWSETGWRFTGGNSIGDDTYNVHFSQLGLYLPPNSGNPKVTCDKGWYASVGIDTRKLVVLNTSYPSGSDCNNMGSVTLTPPHQISCDQNCKSNQESSGMLCYQIDPDGNNYCITKENNTMQILIPPAMTIFGRHVTPQEVTVQIGVNNTVQWTNADDSMYDIVGDKQQFRSGMIGTNSTWTHTFNESGVFGYHGEPAPWLRGQVTVLPANNQTNSTGG